jgi:hypothetical protein
MKIVKSQDECKEARDTNYRKKEKIDATNSNSISYSYTNGSSVKDGFGIRTMTYSLTPQKTRDPL